MALILSLKIQLYMVTKKCSKLLPQLLLELLVLLGGYQIQLIN